MRKDDFDLPIGPVFEEAEDFDYRCWSFWHPDGISYTKTLH